MCGRYRSKALVGYNIANPNSTVYFSACHLCLHHFIWKRPPIKDYTCWMKKKTAYCTPSLKAGTMFANLAAQGISVQMHWGEGDHISKQQPTFPTHHDDDSEQEEKMEEEERDATPSPTAVPTAAPTAAPSPVPTVAPVEFCEVYKDEYVCNFMSCCQYEEGNCNPNGRECKEKPGATAAPTPRLTMQPHFEKPPRPY